MTTLRSILLGSGMQLFGCFGWASSSSSATTSSASSSFHFQFVLWDDPSSVIDVSQRPVLQLPTTSGVISAPHSCTTNRDRIVCLQSSADNDGDSDVAMWKEGAADSDRNLSLESLFFSSLNCVTGSAPGDGLRARLDHLTSLVNVSSSVSAFSLDKEVTKKNSASASSSSVVRLAVSSVASFTNADCIIPIVGRSLFNRYPFPPQS